MIIPRFLPPCRCERCVVACVTGRPRPRGLDLHGRDLARWWASYERAVDRCRHLQRPAPAARRLSGAAR